MTLETVTYSTILGSVVSNVNVDVRATKIASSRSFTPADIEYPSGTAEQNGGIHNDYSSKSININCADPKSPDGKGKETKLAASPEAVEEIIADAVANASPNALRVALFALTGDESLAQMPVSKQIIRGGAMMDYVLSQEDIDLVRTKAADYLRSEQSKSASHNAKAPNKTEARKLMEIFTGHPLDQTNLDLGFEELAFEDFPRELKWSEGKRPSPEKMADYRVAIIGAGICGVSTAVTLKRLGIPYIGLDRQNDIGGTWLQNTYPDARVDTLGHLFQYKFVHGYKWKESYPDGASLREYLSEVAREYDVRKNFLFEREVIAAVWSDEKAKWTLSLQHKEGVEKLEVNAIISASGLFNKPCLPEIAGINLFEGKMVHTTQWDHSFDWKGKRIAVIGNGSSGAQLMPALAREAGSLAMYQRTPNWIAGYDGYRDKIPYATHWLMEKMPFYANWFGYTCFMRGMQLPPLQKHDKEWQSQGGLVNERNDAMRKGLTEYIKTKVKGDPVLIQKLTPTYAPLVRRLVVDNGFYDALLQDNVELVTEAIETFTKTGIKTKDGKYREFDLVVLACGFKPTEYLWPIQFRGRGGVSLEKTWGTDGARSYLGLVIPGYPNLYCLYGPNHQPRGGPSIHSFSEIWGRYALQSIMHMLENNLHSMEVRQEVYDEYNKRLDQAVSELIWEEEGCGYFINKFGRQGVNMPWTTDQYHAMVNQINLQDFDIR